MSEYYVTTMWRIPRDNGKHALACIECEYKARAEILKLGIEDDPFQINTEVHASYPLTVDGKYKDEYEWIDRDIQDYVHEWRRGVKRVLDMHKTLYVKMWQSNRFYPIHKFEWSEEKKTYCRSLFKTHTPYEYGDGIESVLYEILNNACLVNTEEMFDEKNFNDE